MGRMKHSPNASEVSDIVYPLLPQNRAVKFEFDAIPIDLALEITPHQLRAVATAIPQLAGSPSIFLTPRLAELRVTAHEVFVNQGVRMKIEGKFHKRNLMIRAVSQNAFDLLQTQASSIIRSHCDAAPGHPGNLPFILNRNFAGIALAFELLH